MRLILVLILLILLTLNQDLKSSQASQAQDRFPKMAQFQAFDLASSNLNDPRYVNAWLDRAQDSNEGDEFYNYMKSNEIGINCASFYIAWADKYEGEEKFDTAKMLYELGVKHHAEPYETITFMKRAFEERVAEKKLKDASTTSTTDVNTTATNSVKTSHGSADDMLLEEEMFPFQESAAHKKIRDVYKDTMQNLINDVGQIHKPFFQRVMYPMKKYYSPVGEFQLEEILAAKWRQKTGFSHLQENEPVEKSSYTSLRREKEKAEEKLAIKRNQLAQLLEAFTSKMGIEECDDDNEQTVNIQKLFQKMKSLDVEKKADVVVENKEEIEEDKENLSRNLTASHVSESETFDGERSSRHETSSRQLSDLAQPSPTLCTKLAVGDIEAMFNQSLKTEVPSFFGNTSTKDFVYNDGLLSKNEDFKIFCDDGPQQNCVDVKQEKFQIFVDDKPNRSLKNSITENPKKSFEIFEEKQSSENFDFFGKDQAPQNFEIFDDDKQRKENLIVFEDKPTKDSFKIFEDKETAKESFKLIDEYPSKRNFDIFGDQSKEKFGIFEDEPRKNKHEISRKQPFQLRQEKPKSLTKDPSAQSLSETIVAGEVLALNLAEEDDFSAVSIESGLLAESTSHEALFHKSKMPEKSQEVNENNHLSPILEASNEMSSHQNCESLYPNKVNMTSDVSMPGPQPITFNTEVASATTTSFAATFYDSPKLPKLNIVEDPWLETSRTMENFADHILDKPAPMMRKNSQVQLGKLSAVVEGVIGEGGFAKVYRVMQNGDSFAVKVEQPRCEWEIHALKLTKQRLQDHPLANDLFLDVVFSVLFQDASMFVTKYMPYGTLLDFVNYTTTQMTKLSPLQYHCLALQLLSIVDALHSVNIIHGDIKPDNFLVCSDYKSSSSIKSTPKLRLIDFGRAIDMQPFPTNTAFMASSGTSAFVCTQMKLKRPWNYHIDYYGLAGTIYLLLCNQYMKIIQLPNGEWKPQNKLPRWTDGFWVTIISTLLNYPDPADGAVFFGYQASPLPHIIQNMHVAIEKLDA